MVETQDVVIIGAGLIGLSVAYHLSTLGCNHVVVVEHESAWGQGASGRSAGGVRLQFSHPSSVQFSQYALQFIADSEERLGVSIPFKASGYLFLTRDRERWQALRKLAPMQRELGAPVELLTPQAIRERYSYVDMEDLVGGTFCPLDGIGDPWSMLYGLASAARRRGVEIRLSETVMGIAVEGDRVVGVTTNRGTIASPCVVNAAGAYAREIGKMAGISIPVAPYRRSIYVTDAFDQIPADIPMTLDLDTTSYLRREGHSILMGMSDPEEPSSFHTETDTHALQRVVETLLSWVPRLELASIMRGWAGLYAVSPDDSAIIGEVQARPGFFLANGFSGHGFMHAPAAGRVLAELIMGQTPFVDIHPFRLERFNDKKLVPEQFVI